MKHCIYLAAVITFSCSVDPQRATQHAQENDTADHSGTSVLTRSAEDFVVYEKDTIYYPDDLVLHYKYQFQAIRADTSYLLKVHRKSGTLIHYHLSITRPARILLDTTGTATLSESFFLAPEGDDDPESGGYGSYEYLDDKGDCSVRIRIGMGYDRHKNRRAKVLFTCPAKSNLVLDIDNTPVLRSAWSNNE